MAHLEPHPRRRGVTRPPRSDQTDGWGAGARSIAAIGFATVSPTGGGFHLRWGRSSPIYMILLSVVPVALMTAQAYANAWVAPGWLRWWGGDGESPCH